MNYVRKNHAVTLIALVLTIIILLILVAVSMTMLLGENGLITKAIQSGEQMQIASGKEEIDLQVLGMITEKASQNESCTLEYIKENLPSKLEDLGIVGEKGNPLSAFYAEYKGYEYEVNAQYIVTYVGKGDYKEKPDISLSINHIETGVEKVTIEAVASVEEGNIEEIEMPDGNKVSGNTASLEVNQNGDYTFIATSDRGRVTSKTISISNIKQEGIDLTGLITGEDTHNHIYETKYDDTQHWEECIICGNKQNIANHHKQTIGNAATCDVYVTLGQEVCTDNCGYSKQIERLEHIRPTKINWQNYKSKTHIAFQCERCGRGGSNSLSQEHRFNINGKVMTVNEMIQTGINVHQYASLTCTICKLSIPLNKHTFYSNTCYLCNKKYGPDINFNIAENTIENGIGKINLVNNTTQYVYAQVNTNGRTFTQVTARSLQTGTNYNVGTPELVKQEGNIWTYKIPISLIENSKNLTEPLIILMDWYTNLTVGSVLDGYTIGDGTIRAEAQFKVMPTNIKPIISEIQEIDEETLGDWVIKKKLKIKGTAPKTEIVYISMYDADGKTIFEDEATQVVNGNYEYISNYGLEAIEDTNFTIKVKDAFGNVGEKQITLSHVDSQAPTIISEKEFNMQWSKNKEVELEIEDKGIGGVQIAFNNANAYENIEEKEGKYIKRYNFLGDIYQDMQAAIYLKDNLGNITTEKITIGKIDGTSPTITNVSTAKEGENTKVSIEANDINEKLGQEGSGIAGYAITTSKELPIDALYSKSGTITVTTPGTYYIYVKDNAGNLAERQEIVIE